MKAKSDKVQLSFNAGEYSPFLDSRIDIDKASSATRTMRNFVAEVGGTARRRPGLRFVAQIGGGSYLCDLIHSTYEGAGYWCGFPAFASFDGEITTRYLTKTVKGRELYVNSEYGQLIDPTWADHKATITNGIKLSVAGSTPWDFSDPGDVPSANAVNGIEAFWYGQASYDPETGCSLANGLRGIRRTNGNPYPFLMSYGFGVPYSDVAITDAVDLYATNANVNKLANLSGVGRTVGISERIYVSDPVTLLGNQLGTHTNFGVVREILGNENTLYDQLVLDGAQVTSTRSSELISFDDGTGAYEGSASVFSFRKSTIYNVLGQRYVVTFDIRVTEGTVVENKVVTYEYVGTGVEDEYLTIPLPIFENSKTEFVGECIIIYEINYDFDDFQRLDEASWTMGPGPSWNRWSTELGIICGGPAARLSVDSFEQVTIATSGRDLIDWDARWESGYCWDDEWGLTSGSENVSWDDYEQKNEETDLVVWPGGIGWKGLGGFRIGDSFRCFDDFEDYTAGAATTWGENSERWGSDGGFTT